MALTLEDFMDGVPLQSSIQEDDLLEQFIGTPVSSEEYQRSKAFQGAIAIAAANNFADSPEFIATTLNTLKNYQGQHAEDIINEVRNVIIAKQQAAVEAVINAQYKDMSAVSVGGDTLYLADYPEAIQQINEEANSPFAMGNSIADNILPGSADTPIFNQIKEEYAANMYIADLVAQNTKNTSAGFWDYVGLLAATGGLDWQAVADEHPGAFNDIRDTIKAIRDLPTKERKQATEALIKKANKEVGNPLKVAYMLNILLEPDAEELARTNEAVENIFMGMDVSFALSSLGTLFSSIYKANKVAGLAKLDPAVAGKVSAAASADNGLARMAGIPAVEANAASSMLDRGGLGLDIIAPKHASEEIARLQAQIDQAASVLPNIERALWDKDRAKATERITAEADKVQDSLGATARVMQELPDKSGITIDFIVTPASGGYRTEKSAAEAARRRALEEAVPFKQEDGSFALKQTKVFNYELGDVTSATLSSLEGGFFSRFLLTPATRFATANPEIVASATRVELASAVIAKRLKNISSVVLRSSLGRSWSIPGTVAHGSYKKVSNILLRGDAKEKVFTTSQLRYAFKLSDKEIKAYYGMRRVFDNLYQLRNQFYRRQFELENFKTIRNFYGEGTDAIGKIYDTPVAASSGLGNVTDLFNLENHYPVTVDDLAKIYNEDKVIVRLKEGVFVNNSRYDFAVVPKLRIADLPDTVIPYRVGYVPKVNKDAYYFVRQYEDILVNGKKVTDELGRSGTFIKTTRIAGSLKEANAIVTQERELIENLKAFMSTGSMEAYWKMADKGWDVDKLVQEVHQGTRSLSTDFRATQDRKMSDIEIAEELGGGRGRGLFTGARSQEIKYGLDRKDPQRYDAFEALQVNIDNLSNFMSRNEWRLGMERRIIEAYRPHLVDPTVSSITRAQLKPGEEKTKIGQGFLNAKSYLERELRIPSTRETAFRNNMWAIAEWMEKDISIGGKLLPDKILSIPDPVRYLVLDLARSDPAAALRAMAFHPLLGFFGVAQLYVQAQGASIAMSIHPIFGARAVAEYPALRALMQPVMGDAFLHHVAKVSKIKEKELREYYELIHKSGITDTVYSGDWEPVAKGMGIVNQSARKILSTGLVFYKEGELVTRGIALRIAHLKWRKDNPGALFTEEVQKGILSESIRLTLNMHRANRAAWQTGVLSVPTQFMQITAKYVEASSALLFKSKAREGFTRSEAAKLLLGQVLLYGAAGAPFLAVGINYLLNSLEEAGIDTTKLTKEQLKWIHGGFPDLFAYSIFGADIELGGRSAVAKDIQNKLTGVFTGEFEVADLFGAFGGTASRFWELIRYSTAISVSSVLNEDADFATEANMQRFVEHLTRISSTMTASQKAYIWQTTGHLINRKGKLITSIEPNFATMVGTAMGFQPSIEAAAYSLQESVKQREQNIKAVVDILAPEMASYLAKVQNMEDPEQRQEAYNNMQGLLYFWLGGIPEEDLPIVREKITSALEDEKGILGTAYSKYANHAASLLELSSQGRLNVYNAEAAIPQGER